MTYGGAEKVLEEIYQLYPSPIFTLMQAAIFLDKPTVTSFLQKFPHHLYRYYLPLLPWAIERFDLGDFNLILSSSHAVAKGIKKREDQLHICYCHTPMRYAWDLEDQYLDSLKFGQKFLARSVLRALRKWDRNSSSRVDHFVANSHYVADRIERCYGRKADVIYPPVSTDRFFVSTRKEDFYITISRLVPYKKVDLIVKAFGILNDKKLIVVGDGPEISRLKKMATPNVEFLGHVGDIAPLLSLAKGFVFAAEEDFGIAPVEAAASGTPVLAFAKGGAAETVIAGKTGLFFDEQTVTSLVHGIKIFEKLEFDPYLIKTHAERFNRDRFRREYKNFIEEKIVENSHLSRR